MKKIRFFSVALSLAAGLLVIALADVAQAYPSRTDNCGKCHGLTDPSGTNPNVGDFDVANASVTAGSSTVLSFDITSLPAGDPDPVTGDPTYKRGYLTLNGLDQLNIGLGGDKSTLVTTPAKYSPDAEWHSHHKDHAYINSDGRYYAISKTELTTVPFTLEVGADVAPGVYPLKALLAGGRPHDGVGWNTTNTFTLEVLGAGNLQSVPEPGAVVLLSLGSLLGLAFYRLRRKR